jgi:dUTP pyrophosphatase
MMKLKVKKLRPDAHIPKYETPGAACFDLRVPGDPDALSADPTALNVTPVLYGKPVVFDTGLAFDIPDGYVMLIFSRSGHGFNKDTRLANCVGVIDSDYVGEVKVKLTSDAVWTSQGSLYVKPGSAIAQAMVLPVEQVGFEEVEELKTTERGANGFGSTGA